MPATIQLELLAAPRARCGARAAALAAGDALLLAWLALEGPTSRERAAQLIWPASDAASARNALRQRLFRLRKQLGADAVSGSATLALADGVAHDLGHGPGLLGDLEAADAPELAAWLAARRSERAGAARREREARIETLEAAGDLGAALALAQSLLESDPLSEPAHRRVMRLHYLRGDRAAALLAFDRCESLLKHEIGTAPARETIELLATIEHAAAPPPATAARKPVPAAVLRPPRLIGRDAELAALRRGLDAGSVVIVVGEAGMGKTRLLQTLAAADAQWLHTNGRPGDALAPYATLARALRQLIERVPQAVDAALRPALAALLPEFGAAPNAPAPAPAAAPMLAPALQALLRRAAPAVSTLAFDDLQFADDATLDLLQSLLSAPRGEAPLRCCLGLRPPAPGSRLAGLLDALAAAGPQTRLTLQPLGVDDLAALVASLALPGLRVGEAGDDGDDGGALAAQLHQRSGGNPLFALETIKLAWNDGRLAWTADLPRPDTLSQLVAEQLARLGAPALQLARAAAVAGVDFSIELAQALLGRHAIELADAWSELESQQVLRGTEFTHDLIHEALLQGLPEVIARHLHGQTAAWLEGQGRGAEPARVAAHWEAAGQRARALPALRAAAERAHQALREGERIELLLRGAEIAEAAGRIDEAWDLVRSAVEGHMNTIRQADGLPLLDRLEALARTPAQRVRVAGDRAWYTTVLGDPARAIELGLAALAQALPLGDEALLASIRQRLGTAMGMVGRFDEALAQLREAEPWIAAHASADDRCEFDGNLAVVLDNLGRPAEAQVHHRQALAASAARDDQSQLATQLANYALSRLDAGDAEGAAAQLEQAQRIVDTYELAGSSAGFIAMLRAQCERSLGRYAAALQWCDRAEAILAQRNPARVPVARLQRAHVWLDLGQHARALQLLGDAAAAQAAARAMPARYGVRWLVLAARVQRRLGVDPGPVLAAAAALSPSIGWPELGLIVGTEQALAHAPMRALPLLDAITAAAGERALHGAELGARLHACLAAAALREPHCAARARAALELAKTAEALHADRGLRWLAPARALAAADLAAEAAEVAGAGRRWLAETLAQQIAPEFADGFLHQHPTHAALGVGSTDPGTAVTRT
ncbi:MAG: AAA family ATPase [Burkholderiales bacterium]|nr:AAA family ATPase [Burkholderiales bacterium]